MRAAIELFGSKWCSPCGRAKQIIESTNPDARGVTFSYIDVGEDPAYAMKSLPVIFIGDGKLEGPTEEVLRKTLSDFYEALMPKSSEQDLPVDDSAPTDSGLIIEPPAPAAVSSKSKTESYVVGAIFFALGFMGYRYISSD